MDNGGWQIRYLQAVNRALPGVSPRAMRPAAIAFLVIGGLAGAVFWVTLVA
jgi:hypothetical protein